MRAPLILEGKDGAGGGNRTLISSLENWGLNHYTTPAFSMDGVFDTVFAVKPAEWKNLQLKEIMRRTSERQALKPVR